MTATRDPALISGINDTDTLNQLRKAEADLKAELAKQSEHYGPAFPRIAQLQKQIDDIDRSIKLETNRIADTARNDFETAQKNEQLLSAALEKQKQEAFRQNEDTTTLEVLRRDAETSRDLYQTVVRKLKMAGVTAGLRGTNLTLVDPASIPAKPVEPNMPLLLGLGLFGGLFCGIAFTFAAESLDSTVRTPEDAENLCDVLSLGIIPYVKEIGTRPVVIAAPNSPSAEAYRCLRSAILLSKPESPPKIIVFTSSLPKEGKSTTSLNTAIAFALNKHRVLLIDGDMRRPSIHKKLGINNESGLSEVLSGAAPSTHIVPSKDVPGLDILTVGRRPDNPTELLHSIRMIELLEHWCVLYDQVIIDCPPLLGMADSVVLASMAHAVILVVRSGKTHRNSLRRSRDLLEKVSAPLIGVLVNAVNINSESHYDYYGYYGKQYGSYYLKGGK
jgi:capsular exopolysaccharide synthesis family protein